MREHFKRVFGENSFDVAVPRLFQNAWFTIVAGKPMVNAGDLGTITVSASGEESYSGPLTPDKPKRNK